MMLLLKVFGCCSSTEHREAMLCIGAIAHATGSEFGRFIPKFYKYMDMGLQNFKEFQVCAASIEVIGDICRALDDKILPFCDVIISHLFTGLSSGTWIAIGKHFEKYLPNAMLMIQAVSDICAKTDSANEEMMNYNNHLRRGIFDAYSGILQGLKNSKSELMLPHAGHLLQFIEFVFRDKMREESVSKAAVAIMGDRAYTLGPKLKILFKDRAFYADFSTESLDSDDYKMKEITAWT
ncbi:hypothetical protein MKX01_017080 [Papaver californicum]|nr:hypothetical protein MKX01_017080 [Papaver californicum]